MVEEMKVMRVPNCLAAALVATGLASSAGAQVLRGDGSITCGADHVVARGESLSEIAKRAYGDPLLYRLLLDTNRAALGGDPEHIAVGMTLSVPCVDITGKSLTAEEAAAAAASMAAVVKAEGPLTPAELDTLFGPVALFPDAVLAPVLVAATFPLDVVRAGRFLDGAGDLTGAERAAKAAAEPWNESVRELAAGFPDLVRRMSENVDWTEQAGEAVVAQTDDSLSAIQRLRETARGNGYLVSNETQTIEETNGKIVIAPATPGVVYVPTYDSSVVYTTPVVGAPVYHHEHDDVVYVDDGWDDALITGSIILGGAVILDEIFDDDDWNGWDGDEIDWDRGDINIDRGDINVDRDEINIDRDEINRGGGIVAGGGGARIEDGRARLEQGGRRPAAERRSVSDPANREVARQKIEGRKAAGAAPASLGTRRPGSEAKPALTQRRPASASPDRPRAQNVKPSRPAQTRQAPRRSSPSGVGRGGHRPPSTVRGGGARGGGSRR